MYSKSDHKEIGSNIWWLNDTKGVRTFDRFILLLIKVLYLGTRLTLRMLLGRKKRDRLYAMRDMYFKEFLYTTLGALGLENKILIEFIVPEYNYKICCPVNKEDWIVVSKHEHEILRHFTPKTGDIVADIGAHYGRYTIISSPRVGPAGKIVAIEAHPGNYTILTRNIKLNDLKNVLSLNCAAFSKQATLKLFIPLEHQGYTMHHSVVESYLTSKYGTEQLRGKYIDVKADTLDNLFESSNIPYVNWMKIDVEGAEFEVLKGAEKVLSRSKDLTILIEVHGKDTYVPVVEFLAAHSFRIEFERIYDNGEKHILAKRNVLAE